MNAKKKAYITTFDNNGAAGYMEGNQGQQWQLLSTDQDVKINSGVHSTPPSNEAVSTLRKKTKFVIFSRTYIYLKKHWLSK